MFPVTLSLETTTVLTRTKKERKEGRKGGREGGTEGGREEKNPMLKRESKACYIFK